MLIVCPQCAKSYSVSAASLGARGRSVRCVHCRTVWFAPAAEDDTGPASAGAEARSAEAIPGPLSRADAAGHDPADVVFAPDAAGRRQEPGFQFEGAAPARRPADGIPAAASPLTADIEAVAANDSVDQEVARRRRRPRGGWVTPGRMVAALAGIIIALVYARENVVRILPQTGSLYARIGLPVNLRGLVFEALKLRTDTQDDVPVLVVEGTITNVADRKIEIPRVRLALRDQTGNEIYTWSAAADAAALAPGKSQTFRARLASPPPDGHDVAVRFVSRADSATVR